MNIVALGIISWDFRFQRPQQLLSHLAQAGYRILYINEVCATHWKETLQLINEGIYIMNAAGSGYIKDLVNQPDSLKVIVDSIKDAITRLGFENYLLWLDSPYWEPVLEHLNPRLLIYNCMDEFGSFDDLAGRARQLEQQEKKILAKADLTMVTANYLFLAKRLFTRRIELIPNGVDFEHFHRAVTESLPRPGDLPGNSKYIIGYYGAIAGWFDFEAVKAIAGLKQDLALVLIGEVTVSTRSIQNFSNIYFLGEKPYARLPDYLQYFNITLIPFLKNRLTLATNPVKLYEYLAAGKQVFAVDLPEIRKYESFVTLCDKPWDYAYKVKEYLQRIGIHERQKNNAPGHNQELIASDRRIERVRNETWGVRSRQIHQLIKELQSNV